jgi:orotidine-5'-phosphate decarboxylase
VYRPHDDGRPPESACCSGRAVSFADRLIEAIQAKDTPCVVGLDPRVETMPDFISRPVRDSADPNAIRGAICAFHEIVLDAVAPLVPAVKLQIAFYEQYGLAGLQAFAETIAMAQQAGLIVIVDAKRNDIGSTAEAYANAFLGGSEALGHRVRGFDVDCITVSPFLGRDSLEPFVRHCADHGRGIFVLVKTSNPGSIDVQGQAADGETVSDRLARMVDELGADLVGRCGYSSIGAVVGATFPKEATRLRGAMPRAIVLVPGYGAQGGTAEDALANFNPDGLGAVINASRSITYDGSSFNLNEEELSERLRGNPQTMIDDVAQALRARSAA